MSGRVSGRRAAAGVAGRPRAEGRADAGRGLAGARAASHLPRIGAWSTPGGAAPSAVGLPARAGVGSKDSDRYGLANYIQDEADSLRFPRGARGKVIPVTVPRILALLVGHRFGPS